MVGFDSLYKSIELIDILSSKHSLTCDEYTFLLENYSEGLAAYAAEKAVDVRKKIYGTDVYIRGLIEFTNYCRCDCLYCGIRRSNKDCERYRLDKRQILQCCEKGYQLGFRTFVLQGGEDAYYTDDIICDIVSSIKNKYSDCAVTLSIGEKSAQSYFAFRRAGADRYLLRHETADREHYEMLHPENQRFESRMKCLYSLREAGFQVGCGFMTGSPYQTDKMLSKDLKFIESFKPDMCGIGPFIPHHATPFAGFAAGDIGKTIFLLSLIRLIRPNILLPATTALGTVDAFGREKGILAGANVVMPNLSPCGVREKYMLYDNKICTGDESAQCVKCLESRMESIGYQIVTSRGDIINYSPMSPAS